MKILGISAYYHDSAAAILVDGKVVAAVQEERFTRRKNDPGFPKQAITYCLKEVGMSLNELDAVVFYDKPFLKFERILQTVIETAPRGLGLFLRSMPVWLKEKLFLKSLLKRELKQLQKKKVTVPILFSSHHLSHAASTFYASPYQEAAILTIDGVGEWATASIAKGEGEKITMLKQMEWPHSLGLLYAAFTYFLGFNINEGEYKVMGLAPYADPDGDGVKRYYQLITEELANLHPDGSITLQAKYFSYTHAYKMIPIHLWETLFGMKKRSSAEPLASKHAELAFALQKFTEKVVQNMAAYAKEITGSTNLCLAGGVALNCVSNGKLLSSQLFNNIYIQPASGDAGGALGAALAVQHLHFNQPRVVASDYMQSAALGPSFSNEEILDALSRNKLSYSSFREDELFGLTAAELKNGKVVGWFRGRMEFGPRALGFRSILADAMNPEMQKILNLKIKKRESFRPFAPIMLEQELNEYFDDAVPNGYMLFVHEFKKEKQINRPQRFYDLPFSEMLRHAGTDLPAVTHIDYSARIQTVTEKSNPGLYHLLVSYKQLTGRGILINTSFNVKDEPIVCSPDDAIRCFLQTEMDILVMENYLIRKS